LRPAIWVAAPIAKVPANPTNALLAILVDIEVSGAAPDGVASARLPSAAERVAAESEEPERLALAPLRRVGRDAVGALAARADVDLR
jgi:hypothetical protein